MVIPILIQGLIINLTDGKCWYVTSSSGHSVYEHIMHTMPVSLSENQVILCGWLGQF